MDLVLRIQIGNLATLTRRRSLRLVGALYPQAKRLAIHLALADFREALNKVSNDGIIFDKIIKERRWGFKFGRPQIPNGLPTLFNAQPK